MKVTNIIALSAAGYGAFMLAKHFAGSLAFGKPRLKRIASKSNWSQQVFDMELPITAKGGFSVPLNSLRGGVFYGKYKIAGFFLPEDAKRVLNNGEEKTLHVEVTITTSEVVQNLADLINNRDWFNRILVKGAATSKGVTIPFSQPIQLYNE